jgi:hypothetical protein
MPAQKVISKLSIILLPLIVFSVILVLPLSSQISNILRRGNSYLPFVVSVLLLLYVTNKRRGVLSHIYSLTILSALYGFGLSFFWNTAFNPDIFAILGFLPTSDALNYYSAGYAILAGLKIGWVAASYRPLFPVFLSSLFALSELNPMVILAIMAFLNLLGSYLAANEIKKSHGAMAASFYLLFGFLCYRYFTGMFMTEQLGFLLGNLAIAFIWNGIRNQKFPNILLGIFSMSLGLNARAGAMFVLPVMVIWVGLATSKKKFFSLKRSSLAFIAVLLGFVINYYVSNQYFIEASRTFSNWGYSLYGVAAGNAGWRQILDDYPGTSPPEAQSLAIQKIIQNPILFAKGVLLTYRDYFEPVGKNNLFAFLWLSSNPVKWALWIWALCSLIFLLLSRNNEYKTFLLYSLIGIVLSIPFAPPRDGGWRLFMVTNPIHIGILVSIFPWLNSLINATVKKLIPIKHASKVKQPNEIEAANLSPIFLAYGMIAAILVFILILPRLIVPTTNIAYANPENYCEDGETPIGFWTHRNGWIQIVPKAAFPKGIFLPYMTPERIEQSILNSGYATRVGYDALIPFLVPGSAIGVMPYNFFAGNHFPELNRILVIANTDRLPKNSGFMVLCGNLLPVESQLMARIFVAEDYKNPEPGSTVSMIPYQTQRVAGIGMLSVILLITIDSIRSIIQSNHLVQYADSMLLRTKKLLENLFSE